jgi:hypothetical protein
MSEATSGILLPAYRYAHAGYGGYPRPTNGIRLAITVMNSTFVSSGRLAM